MNEDLFPSGEWVGFFTYVETPDRHPMDLYLSFTVDGQIDGSGLDDLGPFAVRGTYDTNELTASFTKSFPGSHDVFYEGVNKNKRISGSWHVDSDNHGSFKIWPKELGGADSVEEVKHEEEVPVEIVEQPPLIT